MTLCVNHGYVSHAKNETEIPSGKHWAILTFETIHISSGWEKDGELGSSETITRYHVFKDEISWGDALRQLATKKMDQKWRNDDPFLGLVVAGKAELSVDISVKVDGP
jgi:hypothetical protein